MATAPEPEQYTLPPTAYCPNSALPLLIYRNVLPKPVTEDSATAFLQRFGWEKRGAWGAITVKHYHPNTHECYGVYQGTSDLIFGVGGADDPGAGVTCRVGPGDVIVVPAGVAHASVSSELDDEALANGGLAYMYVGVYPADGPEYRYELGTERVGLGDPICAEIAGVPVPRDDPVSGADGPLCRIWRAARKS